MTVVTGRRLVILSIILGASLLAGSLAPPRAHAAISLCRADPIVVLSNGVIVQLTISFPLLPSDVKSIKYALRTPRGTTVSGIVFTGGSVTQLESMTVTANDASGTYDSSSIVYSNVTRVPVTATEQVAASQGAASRLSSATGLTNQFVLNHVHQ